jgi:glycerol-3-phosphate dehydrogenase (NAD(P)+)
MSDSESTTPQLDTHPSKPTIAILGAGAWGSALATLAKANGHPVRVWSRQGELTLAEAVTEASIVVSAISMQGVRSVVEQMQATPLRPDAILVTATKGLDPVTTHTPSHIWQTAFPSHPIAVLSGPNLSKEIQQGLPAATVVASTDEIAATTVQTAFFSNRLRVYTSPDPLGVELGGTLKNVIAIAVGACDGLQLGTNAKAALVTRGLAEIIRVGLYWGANPQTFYGLSGLGDLLATCNSPLSRNYQVGYGLAQGKTLDAILTHLEGTAEGVHTTPVLVRLAQAQKILIPISHQVSRLLNGEISPQVAVNALMLRDSKTEIG